MSMLGTYSQCKYKYVSLSLELLLGIYLGVIHEDTNDAIATLNNNKVDCFKLSSI